MSEPGPPLPEAHCHRVGWIGLGLAIAYWVLEGAMHRLFFGAERSEWVPGDWDEIWMRALICALFIALGAYTDLQMRWLTRAQRERAALQAKLEASLA
jgi:hypothetical protein